MDIIAGTLIQKLVGIGLSRLFKTFGKGFVSVFKRLGEYAGLKTSSHYQSVSDFWYKGLEEDNLKACAKITINGIISLYTPLCPGHPLSRPGRQLKTWVDSKGKIEEFSIKDFVIWGDGILVSPISKSNKTVIGMYDQYGLVGLSSLPLILDLNISSLKSIYTTLHDNFPMGLLAEVTGCLIDLPYFIFRELGLVPQDIAGYDELTFPNYALEAFEIKTYKQGKILFGTQWIGLEESKVFPIYLNLFNKELHKQSSFHLIKEYLNNKDIVSSVFDPKLFVSENLKMPLLNQELENMFNKI